MDKLTQPTWVPGVENSYVLVNRYMALLQEVARFASGVGVRIVAFSPVTFQRFLSLSEDKQLNIYNRLLTYHSICESAIANGISLKDNGHSLAWWALRELKLRPPSDLFQYLKDDDIIEIYNHEGVQIFRSFCFFNLCVYPLDQILTHEWYELYSRDESITQGMLDMAQQVLTGDLPGITFSNFPDHVVEQNLGGVKTQVKIRHRFMARLTGANNDAFFFNVFRVID